MPLVMMVALPGHATRVQRNICSTRRVPPILSHPVLKEASPMQAGDPFYERVGDDRTTHAYAGGPVAQTGFCARCWQAGPQP